jgi:hypothetical protein
MAKTRNPIDTIIDAGRAESPKDPIDEEVTEEFKEAEQLGQGNILARKLQEYTDKQPILSGGDIDAAWDQADAGDETVGGDNPTPDQDVVEELGLAAGITYDDTEPLHTTEKMQERDKRRWELDPASSEDYHERNLVPSRGSRRVSKSRRK